MLRRSRFATLIWLLAIALVPVRVANAHLHVCLDGKEPAIAVHLQDAPTHNGVSNQAGHNDRDVSLSATLSITKSESLDQAPLPLIDADVWATLLPVQHIIVPSTAVLIPDLSPSFDLRPPSRGPPC